MRFTAPILSLLAAIAAAQSSTCNVNCILVPNTGLNVKAGQSFQLSWSNPSSGTLTIKLQLGNDITPGSGRVLATKVDASSGKTTVEIPSDVVLSNQYTFETIDESNPSNINFSPQFAIQGATGVSTAVSSTSSGSSRTSSSSGTMTSSSSSGSSSSTATRTSSESSSRTSSSASSTATTAAPNSNANGAANLKVEGALMAIVAVAMAAF